MSLHISRRRGQSLLALLTGVALLVPLTALADTAADAAAAPIQGTTLDPVPTRVPRGTLVALTGRADPHLVVHIATHRVSDPPDAYRRVSAVRPAADGTYRASIVADADTWVFAQADGQSPSQRRPVETSPSVAGPRLSDLGETVPLIGHAPAGARVTVVLFRRAADGTLVRRLLPATADARGNYRVTYVADAAYRYYALVAGQRSAAMGTNVRPVGSTPAGWMPSPPFTATFFYPWYATPTTDAGWMHWNQNGYQPPQNWFSNYLPDPLPGEFRPGVELYSSMDDQTIYWQLSQMATARQQVAISSWFGQGQPTDNVFAHIITDVMNRPDNPYPNLRWAVYYEPEGYGNPTVDQLVSDLSYIKSKYASQPAYLKVGGRPVVFVYNAPHAGSSPMDDLARWQQARARTGFYVDMVLAPLTAGAPANAVDSWHDYYPAAHSGSLLPYYAFASPGFWLAGQAPRLAREPQAFDQAVQRMAASGATWQLTETWNEWHEGTAVEPGTPVHQTMTGTATPDPAGPVFGETYVDLLARSLPPLPAGTGAAGTPGAVRR